MSKKLRDIVKSPEEREVEKAADERYQGVVHDLPKEGNYHYLSAIDHIADTMHDNFPHFRDILDFKKIATSVVSRYVSNDTQLSKRNEVKQERAWARAQKIKDTPPKEPKIKPIKIKPRRGVGSY